eukprot:2319383-Pyramimonas_sp.AAC.1
MTASASPWESRVFVVTFMSCWPRQSRPTPSPGNMDFPSSGAGRPRVATSKAKSSRAAYSVKPCP